MLAKNLRAPRGVRFPESSSTTIASMLAPAMDGCVQFRGLALVAENYLRLTKNGKPVASRFSHQQTNQIT